MDSARHSDFGRTERVRLGLFALLLVVMVGAGAAVGAAVGPIGGGGHEPVPITGEAPHP